MRNIVSHADQCRRRFQQLRRRATVQYHPRRSALAISEQDRQGRTGTQAPGAVLDPEARRHQGASRRRCGRRYRPPLSLGSQRASSRRPCGRAGLGLSLQGQHRLAKGSQGRRTGRSWRRVLFPQRHRAVAVRRSREKRSNPAPGRTQVNTIATRKREHSRKPDEQYPLITSCSPGPYLEMFARGERPGWAIRGDQADGRYVPDWPTYANHSQRDPQTATLEF